MNILVTGGAGFIGSHVVDLLVAQGHQVLVVDDLSTGGHHNLEHDVETLKLDISMPFIDAISLGKFVPEAILHLAAQASITVSQERPGRDLKVNAMGTLNVIDVAKAFGVRRIVFASTSAVYEEKNTILRETDTPRPGSPYGVSKLAAEGYLRALFPETVILRLGNVYGPRQVSIGENQVVARMLNYLEGETDSFSIHGDGHQKRDFVYVEDVARAFVRGLEAQPGIYNVATGKSVSVNGVAAALARIYGHPLMVWQHDDNEDLRRDVKLAVLMAQSKLGWQAEVNLADGLRRTMLWRKADDGSQRSAVSDLLSTGAEDG